MNAEKWKDIPGFEGLYQVSNFGNIKSLDHTIITRNNVVKKIKGKDKSLNLNHKGYLKVSLMKNNVPKNYFVHRLVAEVFISNPNHLPQVNHRDEIKTNNCVDNLEWCTAKYNSNYGTRLARRHDTLVRKGRYFT